MITCIIRYQIDPFQRDVFKLTPRTGDASFPAAAVILSVTSCLMKARTMSPGDSSRSIVSPLTRHIGRACDRIQRHWQTSQWRKANVSFSAKREILCR